MRRLKISLCSSMSQERLNHTHNIKSRVDSLDLLQIAQAFIFVREKNAHTLEKCV